jgi:hypothetical protein
MSSSLYGWYRRSVARLSGLEAKGSEACPICGMRRRLSDEDVIPTWARRHVMLLASFGPREQHPRRVKMRICTVCNSTLGQIFERRTSELVKPMLHGSTVILNRKDQLHITCWIIKTSLLTTVMGLQQGDPDRVLALAMIRRLMVERLPPVRTLIRIFTRDIEDEGPAAGSAQQARVHAPRTAFFSITSIGCVGWEMAIGPDWPVLVYQSETSERPGYLQIWPPREAEVRWPPSTVVNTQEIHALRAAYLASSTSAGPKPTILRWGGPEDRQSRES